MVRHAGGGIAVERDRRSFLSLDELVEYFRCSRGRLATRLRRALSQATLPVKALMTSYCEMYEIERADVSLIGETLSCLPSDVDRCQRIYVGAYKHSAKVRHLLINQSVNQLMKLCMLLLELLQYGCEGWTLKKADQRRIEIYSQLEPILH